MKRIAKALAALLTVIIAVPVLALGGYYATEFLPRQDAVRALLADAHALDRDPPAAIRRYIEVMHRDGASVTTSVVGQLDHRLLPRTSNLTRIARGLAWTALLPLHYSDRERMGLYSTLAYNGRGHGLNALALRLFAKPLDALSEREAATVVAYTWAPGIYERYPEQLAARGDKLLAAARAMGD